MTNLVTPTSLRKRNCDALNDTQRLINRPDPRSPTKCHLISSSQSHINTFSFLAPQQLGAVVLPSPSFSGPSTGGENHYYVNHQALQQIPLTASSLIHSSGHLSSIVGSAHFNQTIRPIPPPIQINRSQYLLRSTSNRLPYPFNKRQRLDPSLLPSSPSIQATDFPSLKRLLRMLEKERNKLPVSEVSEKDAERNQRMRAELIEVILHVTTVEGYEPETAFVAANFLDRYLAKKRVTLQRQFYAIALACLFVATKVVEENREPNSEAFSQLSPVLVSPDQIKKMEKSLVNMLEWNLEVVTPHALWHELHVFGTQLPDPSGEALNDYVNACLRKNKLLNQPASAYVTGLLTACGFDIKTLPYPDKWTRAR